MPSQKLEPPSEDGAAVTVADDLATLRSALQRRDEHERRGAWQSPTPEQLALDRVEAEIARLEGNQHHLTAEWRDKALAAEAEAARLRDGLRPAASRVCVNGYQTELNRSKCDCYSCVARRALLAEDGAA